MPMALSGWFGRFGRVALLVSLAMILVFASPPIKAGVKSLESQVEALNPYLGGYPPEFSSEAEQKKILKQYNKLLDRVQKELSKTPDVIELLSLRATLYVYGHNLDIKDSGKKAEDDFRTILTRVPSHMRTLREAAFYFVNSGSPAYAENLFRDIQCYQGNTPDKEAQIGLWFAFMYQGKMRDAKNVASFLVKTWPDEAELKNFEKMVDAQLNAEDKQVAMAATPNLTTCQKKMG